jgi:pimeloyl-ACP methyl ester carboxylesterase
MPRIVVVNGVGGNSCGTWRAGLRAGLARAGFGEHAADDTSCVSYRDVFWPAEAVADQLVAADERAHEDLACLSAGHRPAGERRGGLPWPVRQALRTIGGHSRLCSDLLVFGIARHFVSTDLRLVRRYFAEPDSRAAALDRLAGRITPDTRILIGHSFGSVIAYEALCSHPEWPVRMLITLGSPLGIRALISSRLNHSPVRPSSRWPGSIGRWVNVSDPRDIISVTPALNPYFGPGVEDHQVDNGARPHALIRYLATEATGRAIGSYEQAERYSRQSAADDLALDPA